MATMPLLSEYLGIDCKPLIGSRREVVVTQPVVVVSSCVFLFDLSWYFFHVKKVFEYLEMSTTW